MDQSLLKKDKIYETLKEKIIDFSFKPGEQLVEQVLSEQFEISKSPLREAFRQLEADGLVNLIPYKGAYVSILSTKELNDICELREALEVFCLERGLNAYSNEDIEELEALTELSRRKVEREEEIEAFKTHLSIHYLIIKKSKNKLIEDAYWKIHNKMRRYLLLGMKLRPETIKTYNADHYKILSFIKARDIVSAVEELRRHFSHVNATLLGDGILEILLRP